MAREALLRLPDVRSLVGLSRSEIYRRMRAGEFPQSVNIGARAVAWPSSLIEDFVQQRISESRKAAKADGGAR